MSAIALTYFHEVQDGLYCTVEHPLAALEYHVDSYSKYCLPCVELKGKDGETPIEITAQWPSDGHQRFEFKDLVCSILHIDVRTSDGAVQSVFACNCFRDSRMSPGAYLDNLEVMMKKCYELTTAVTLPSVEQIVRIVDDALHNTIQTFCSTHRKEPMYWEH